MIKQVVSIVHNIPAKGGGVTRVSLIRAQQLAQRGLVSRIATLGYRTALGRSYLHFLQQGVIGPEVQVFNFYTWMSMCSMEINPHQVKNTRSHTHTPQWVVERKSNIHALGVKVHQYINPCGQVFLEEYVNAQEDVDAVVFSRFGNPTQQFSSMTAAHAWWLEQLVADVIPAVLIADATSAASAVGTIQAASVYKILMMHNSHLVRPDPVESPIVSRYGGLIENIGNCDSLVVLTQEQLRDLNARFPEGRYHVIGNPIMVRDGHPVEREPDLAVVVARLSSQKRIANIIRAFEKVQLARPSARLEIWGSGELEQDIQALIESRGLNDFVTLMGFAVDVGSVFKRASVSLAMSAFEGLPIAFVESLAYGTPMVSLKTKYGPEEIITSGEDGFLVNDENEFVEKVVALLSDPELVRRMGAAGIANMRRFSPENIGNIWIEHFETLLTRPPACGSIFLDTSKDKYINIH